MNNRTKWVMGVCVACLCSGALAAGKKARGGSDAEVYRYADPSTGKVVYSNVPIKGARGEKVEIIAYPPASNPEPMFLTPPLAVGRSAPTGAPPIPPEILRALQEQMAKSGGSVLPPSALPALPAAVATLPSQPAAKDPVPMPAVPVPDSQQATAGEDRAKTFASDPFSGKH